MGDGAAEQRLGAFSLARGLVQLSFAMAMAVACAAGSGSVHLSFAMAMAVACAAGSGSVHLSFAIAMAVALPAVRRTSRGRQAAPSALPGPA
ncbi:hypothetical protein, partial [Pantoea sp.]|uniref:hypothetical protein n=1 Tax=Pantoea sp. TaxID=69393 RepID=UPI0031DE4271